MKFTKKEIIKLVDQIERLGMDCSLTKEALKNKEPIDKIRLAFRMDSSIIQGQINDISLLINAD